MIAILAALGVCAACALLFFQFARGPTTFDRLLMAHAVWVNAALVIACLAAFVHDAVWLDLALALVLIDAALVLAGVKALRRNSFQPALTPLDENGAP